MADKNSVTTCNLCNVPLLNAQSKLTHVLGKKHQLALHREQMVIKKERCSVFVSGFPNLLQHEEILNIFSGYGRITEHFFGNHNQFAIIQYNNEESVENVLCSTIILGGKRLIVKRRVLKTKQTGHNEIPYQSENYDEIHESIKDLPDFQAQVTTLLHHLQPNWDQLTEKYALLCRDLRNVLEEAFPGCIVHPFGSTVTGLSFTTSDVDVYVEVPKSASGEAPIDTQTSYATTCVNKSKKLLQKYGHIFSPVQAIPRAKTPIIKCVHKPTNTSCDFNFKNKLGIYNSCLIKYYLSLDEKLKPTMMILKYWAKLHEFSGGSGKFSNYSLILLLIFYLQQKPYSLPSVIDLQNLQDHTNLQDGWNGEFSKLETFISEPLINATIPEILQGFFDYYACFDYSLNVVCPFLGSVVLRTDFFKPEFLSDLFKLYKINIAMQQPLRADCPVCIQDPFEHNHNVTSSVPAKLLDEFVGFCKLSTNIFKSRPLNNTTLYRLFTDEFDGTEFKRYMGNDSQCMFKIAMGSHLLYLDCQVNFSKQTNLDSEKKQRLMREVWYDMVNKFVITVLIKVMKFHVSVEKHSPDNKAQRLNGQNDVHDTNIVDSVCFHCSGTYNLWETRKLIARDMSLGEPVPLLNKKINITNYICNVLYKDLKLDDNIIDIRIVMQSKVNPTEMIFHITKLNNRTEYFKPFAIFFAKNIPVWFEKHLAELDCNITPIDEEPGNNEKPKEQTELLNDNGENV